jgi:hypothetical protein
LFLAREWRAKVWGEEAGWERVDGRKGSAVFRQRNVLAKEWAAGDWIEVWWSGDGLFKRS